MVNDFVHGFVEIYRLIIMILMGCIAPIKG